MVLELEQLLSSEPVLTVQVLKLAPPLVSRLMVTAHSNVARVLKRLAHNSRLSFQIVNINTNMNVFRLSLSKSNLTLHVTRQLVSRRAHTHIHRALTGLNLTHFRAQLATKQARVRPHLNTKTANSLTSSRHKNHTHSHKRKGRGHAHNRARPRPTRKQRNNYCNLLNNACKPLKDPSP